MYSNNKQLPKIRRDAAEFARKNGVRVAARRFGVHPGTISKWVQKSKRIGNHPIPTKSSKPKKHPKQIKEEIVKKIVEKRIETGRSSEVIHEYLKREGVEVSLSTVKRTLNRKYLIKKRSLWKRFHPHVDRPIPKFPGDLVELDSIHLMVNKKERIYVMTLIDVNSRFAFAYAYQKISSKRSVDFVTKAKKYAPFKFQMLQTDHGPEFGKHFQDRIQEHHRFTRIGKPNDNSHIERFNRTIQEELLDKISKNVLIINQKLCKYLEHYNTQRLHFGINLKTPQEVLDCFQAID